MDEAAGDALVVKRRKLDIYEALCEQADNGHALPFPVDQCWAKYWEVETVCVACNIIELTLLA